MTIERATAARCLGGLDESPAVNGPARAPFARGRRWQPRCIVGRPASTESCCRR